MEKQNYRLSALRAAFPCTIPVLTGFLFLGITYGVYAVQSGLPFWMPMLMSLVIFGGSLEFVAVEMLIGTFNPLACFLLALMIQARHLFYGIAMLDKYRGVGPKKIYMIFGLCDETFSINCAQPIPNDIDSRWFMFFVTALDQFYWFSGATIGALFGAIITFNTEGLEFAMTALFVVIFIEQWRKEKKHISAIAGSAISIACLLIFGSESFLIPSMIGILLALTMLRGRIGEANAE